MMGATRKAQFFSLTAALLVIVILVMYYVYKSHVDEREQLRVTRAQLIVTSSFAQNFATLDVPRMLRTSARLALTSRSQAGPLPMDPAELTDIMRDGSAGGKGYFNPAFGTDAQLGRALSTLPFAGPEDARFNYSLVSIGQASPDTLRLTFSVNYSLRAQDAQWSEQERQYDITVKAYSVYHPVHGGIIDETWVPDGGCLAQLLFSGVGACAGNLKPDIPEMI